MTAISDPEYDQRLREALAERCLALSDTPGDDLREVILYRIHTRLMSTYALRLHLLLHAAALGAQCRAEGLVEGVADAARAVHQWNEDDGCRPDCDNEPQTRRVRLACDSCAEWPHLELDERLTELLRFVGSRVGRSGFEGLVA